VAPAVRPAKGGSRGLLIGLVFGVIIVLLAIGALVVFGLGGGRGTQAPTATEVIAQAATATSEPTQPPTNTPVVQVVTATPEDTPIPAPTEPPPVEPSPLPTEAPPEPTDTPLPEPTQTSPPEPTATPTSPPTNTPVPPTQGPTNTPQPTATPTSPPAPAVSGKIAFSAGGALHIVDAATGQDTAPPLSGIRQPDFRADGREILANGEVGQWTSIVNIDASNGAVVRNQTSFTDDFHPFWAPDGTRFTYDSLHHGLPRYGLMLYTQGLTGGNPQSEVTVSYEGRQIQGHSPVWMHDDYIAFTGCDYWPGGTDGSRCGIYRIPSWGESRPALLRQGGTDMRATDNYGGQLVFMSQEEGNWEVYIMPAGGGNARNLSQSPTSNDGLGTFSPDGNQVAFASNREGGWAVWVVRVDGSGVTKLFNLPGAPTAPWYEDSMSWGP
jgi:hypothetical protein